MFVWDEICKAFSFSLTFTILASIFVLDLIAIDRYRKICIPFEKQLSAETTNVMVALSITLVINELGTVVVIATSVESTMDDTCVLVYLIILMVIGVFGNLLVLYVYKFRFKRSTSRVFILSLAAFDLMTCLFGMPYHILDMVYPYMFVWDEICKAFSFSLTFTILASIFVLDLIAIDRYRNGKNQNIKDIVYQR
jgi:hypothetical protein